ncbi:DUF456 domain-containing protein [bacterium]|nr:MAG: DUF456 domain-containing protein [bacterium]
MWDALSAVAPWLWYALLLTVVLAGLFLNILGLPGLWLIVVAAIGYAWGFEWMLIGKWTLLIVFALAVFAEIVEFLAGAAGSKSAGGSKRGMAGAVAGGLIGGIVGSVVIPIPIVGTIIGSVAGTFAGAYVVEVGVGKTHGDSLYISAGAAKGRIWGMIWKSLFGVVMAAIIAVAGLPLASKRTVVQPPPTLPVPTPTSQPTLAAA